MIFCIIRRAFLALAALSIGAASVAHAQETTLKIGDKAPALNVGKWIKGEPVKEFAPGTVYVLENWATWCGPCREVIPHVTELQHKYKDSVVVIGQNVLEDDQSLVEPFVIRMGDKMDYRVVLDSAPGEAGEMARNWLIAAGQNGIPCSFIVDKKGIVAWIGHPMEMEKPLEQIVNGTYDMAAAIKQAEEKAAAEKILVALDAELTGLVEKGDVEGAFAVLDKAADKVPSLAESLPVIKFRIAVVAKKPEKFYEIGEASLDTLKDNPEALNQIAWIIAAEPSVQTRDLKLALKFAERSVELTKRQEPTVLDTLARVQFENGDAEKAVATQTEAMALANEDEKPDYQKALDTYKAGNK